MTCHRALLMALTATCLSLGGCGQAVSSGRSGSDKGPEVVTAEFLEAVRAGDDQKVSGFLTALARERTLAMDMVVAPPGSETAEFRVHDARVTATTAEVDTEWSDLDTDGLVHTDQIIWLLRSDSEGWRIWGMQSRVFDDQEPVVLNFEDPQQMIDRQRRAEDELARRERERGLLPSDAPPAGHDSRR